MRSRSLLTLAAFALAAAACRETSGPRTGAGSTGIDAAQIQTGSPPAQPATSTVSGAPAAPPQPTTGLEDENRELKAALAAAETRASAATADAQKQRRQIAALRTDRKRPAPSAEGVSSEQERKASGGETVAETPPIAPAMSESECARLSRKLDAYDMLLTRDIIDAETHLYGIEAKIEEVEDLVERRERK